LPTVEPTSNPAISSDFEKNNTTTPSLSQTPTDTPSPEPISVDSCGANPWDDQPDSEAIQKCIDRAKSGDSVLFTSGINQPGYQGYLIDKTIYLVLNYAKANLSFTATDPDDYPLLQATDDLKGFVVSLVARSRVPNYGRVDNITISNLKIDGNRENRICYGEDNIGNGLDDSWGTWLWSECPEAGNGLCNPGTLSMCGASDLGDIHQNYQGYPDAWSTGLVVENVHISNTECATALSLCGAASTIRDTTIETAGDKVLNPACESTDPDEPEADWSDGITFEGPGHTIIGNTIIDSSDVGIVFFGGRDTKISYNTVVASEGNHGMFAAIAIHPWGWGDVSGLEITNNTVKNEASTSCGGIHAGINIGAHMWNGACVGSSELVSVGNPNHCSAEPSQPKGTSCNLGEPCQIWAHVAEGETLTLTDNYVAGAQINYLVEGLDLVGTLIDSGNVSVQPRYTDWETDAGCGQGGMNDRWGAHDFVAHHPTLPGWTDKRVHCEY
jgi:hypothetical protein